MNTRVLARLLRKRRKTNTWLALRDLTKPENYLGRVGWLESVFLRAAVDGNGSAIPWLTYPAIVFIEGRLRPEMSLFEYGSGNSTLWWAQRVSKVVACEHDRSWYEKMAPQLPANAEYIFSNLEEEYTDVVSQYQAEFDVIVIDGRERVRCAQNALPALKPDGVIVWDNTNREKYQPGFDFLQQAGFRRIDFHGMVPITPEASCTSIFYRTANCFGI